MSPFRPKPAKTRLRYTADNYFDLIKAEMALVEAEFERQASSNIQVIGYLSDYLRASGGKRVRPSLLILANYASGGIATSDSVIRLATVMEMLHTATLVHDDIIDNATVRRSRPSVNARFGNHTAVLMGDWLYMSAFESSLRERSLEILDILTRLTRMMTEGELIQLTVLGNSHLLEGEYFDILKRKTAYLFSACCEIGAILGGAGLDQRAALRDFGLNLGIAFQLADDLLDFTSSTDELGKSVGADLIEGKLTLPLILLREADRNSKPILEEVMYRGSYPVGTQEILSARLRTTGALEKTRERAREFATLAIKNLEVLPETRYRSALEAIPSFVVDRKK